MQALINHFLLLGQTDAWRRFLERLYDERAKIADAEGLVYDELPLFDRMRLDTKAGSVAFEPLVESIAAELPWPRQVPTNVIRSRLLAHLAGLEKADLGGSADEAPINLKRFAHDVLYGLQFFDLEAHYRSNGSLNAWPGWLKSWGLSDALDSGNPSEPPEVPEALLAIREIAHVEVAAPGWLIVELKILDAEEEKSIAELLRSRAAELKQLRLQGRSTPVSPPAELPPVSPEAESDVIRPSIELTAPFWQSHGSGACVRVLPFAVSEHPYDNPSWLLRLLPPAYPLVFLAVLDGPFYDAAAASAVRQLKPVVSALLSHLVDYSQSSDTTQSVTRFYSDTSKLYFHDTVEVVAHGTPSGCDFDNRLRCSFDMICEADKLSNPGLSLATCFAAAEGLLGDEESGKAVDPLTKRGAALLQPDPNKRAAAKRAIGRLYAFRNEVMHGRGYGVVSAELKASARRFAVGVLIGAIHFRRHFTSCVDGENLDTVKDWAHELDTAYVREQLVVGVPDLSHMVPESVPTIDKLRKGSP